MDEWQQLQIQNQTRLVVTADVETYLTDCQEQLEALLKQMEQAIDAGERIAVDADGSLHLKRAGKTTPDETKGWRRRLYGHMPQMQLAEVITEVDGWTNFLQMFTHLTTGEPASDDNKRALIATLMGLGLKLGLAQMAPATDFSEKQLTWTADWYIRDDTLQQAQVLLDNFVLHHPYSRHWGQGTTSSSDGLRVLVPVAAANAGYNARYFGFKRGVTIVTHAADIWMPFESVIINDAQEALHVIDALCHHETDFDIQEHYTDSGGATYHVFALCMMLGFRFAPRLRSAAEQYLYTVNPISVAEPLQPLLKGTVDTDLIHENWAEMRRLAASIRHGQVSAALIMRKLVAYPRQHRLAQAFSEVGKLERSLFLLQYLPDEAWQQHIRRELNKGEAIHALARALAFGRSGDLYEYELAAQMNRASSLMLLMSIISVWNTVYLDRVVTALQAQGVEVPSEYLAHISPLGWGHINLLGKYEIDLNQTFPLNQLRPLPFLSASL